MKYAFNLLNIILITIFTMISCSEQSIEDLEKIAASQGLKRQDKIRNQKNQNITSEIQHSKQINLIKNNDIYDDYLIETIQYLLNKKSYNAGGVDGIVGKKTISAIKSFQKDIKQPSNGKVSKTLLLQLCDKNKDLGSTYNEIAILYNNQKKYTKAEQLYMRALKIKKRIFGKNHLNTITILNNLIKFYKEHGKNEKAKELQNKYLKQEHIDNKNERDNEKYSKSIIQKSKNYLPKLLKKMPNNPNYIIIKRIINQPDFNGILRKYGGYAIFDSEGELIDIKTMKVFDFKEGTIYPIRSYSKIERNYAQKDVLDYQKNYGYSKTEPIAIISESFRLALATSIIEYIEKDIAFLLTHKSKTDSEEIQLKKLTSNSEVLIAADSIYKNEENVRTSNIINSMPELTKDKLNATFFSNIQSEILIIVNQINLGRDPEFNVQINNSVEKYMINAPILNPKDPKFHFGNASFWQETFFSRFIEKLNASPSFKFLGHMIFAQNMIFRSPSFINEHKAMVLDIMKKLGPKNQIDYFIVDYINLTLADYAQCIETIKIIDDSLADLPKTEYSQTRIIAQRMLLAGEKLRTLAFRPKFALGEAPIILATANATDKLAISILSKIKGK